LKAAILPHLPWRPKCCLGRNIRISPLRCSLFAAGVVRGPRTLPLVFGAD